MKKQIFFLITAIFSVSVFAQNSKTSSLANTPLSATTLTAESATATSSTSSLEKSEQNSVPEKSSQSKADFSAKSNFLLGITPFSKEAGEDLSFDSAYFLSNFEFANKYLTAGGKFYYRLSLYDDKNDLDSQKTLSQKLDLKRAYFRVRPFANKIFEASIGKLYSYYLPGNFFSLAEIYTGASRWGKTGIGVKSEIAGFLLGAAIPLTESYAELKNNWGINAALVYDFSSLNKNFPVKLGTSFLYSYTYSESQDKSTKEITGETNKNYSASLSVNFAPKTCGFISKLNTSLTYSYNAEPYVASSVFKNVANYSAENLDKCHLISVNHKNNFGNLQFVLEAEAGHSLSGTMIPIYTGTQISVFITKNIALKPRFFYYAALNTENKSENCQTFEFYPRVNLNFGQKKEWSVYAGFDFSYMQDTENNWNLNYSLPLYVEYKM